MPNECYMCGRYKPCRQEKNYAWLTFRDDAVYYVWICQECDIAKQMIKLKNNKDTQDKLYDMKLNWIKERDKILKQHEKR